MMPEQDPDRATTPNRRASYESVLDSGIVDRSIGECNSGPGPRSSFRKCAPCHSVGEDATNKVGPILNGLDGRKAGAVEGFSYSDANKNSGITWNEETFKEYIRDPRAKVPGTKMIFAG